MNPALSPTSVSPAPLDTRTLTAAELGVWFATAALDPSGSTFNVGDCLEIAGPVVPGLLQEAHELLSGEVEACRATFTEGEEGPRLVLGDNPVWPLEVVDLRNEPKAQAVALAWMEADMRQSTDLQSGPLFSSALFLLAPDRVLYYCRGHHIVLDGFSLDILGRRLAEIYTALSVGRTLVPRVLGGLDVLAGEDAAYRASARSARDRAYWLARLDRTAEPPTLAARPAPGPRGTQRVRTDLGPGHTRELFSAAKRFGVTWPDLAIAVTAAYIAGFTGRTDLVLGLPISGRTSKSGRNVPGMTANILPMPIACEPAGTWSQLAKRVRAEVREASLHGLYRSEDMLRDLGLVGTGRSVYGPLINVLGLQTDLRFGQCQARHRSVHGVGVEDIAFTFRQNSAVDVELIIDANPRLYTAGETEGHLRRMLAFLDAVLAVEPDAPLSAVGLVDEQERATVLEWGAGVQADASAGLVPGLFARQATLTPGAVAVQDATVSMTYGELDDAANRLARLLVSREVGPGDVVALWLTRSARMVVAMLAVLRTGAAYLPLDPGYPAARLAYMAADACPAVILTESGILARAASPSALWVDLDDPSIVLELEAMPGSEFGAGERLRVLTPDHPAYVIYTSGSTGEPKGVVVPQRGAANLRNLAVERFALGPDTRLLQFVSPSFDMSVADVWMTLLTGGTLLTVDKDLIQPGPELEQFLNENAVTHVMLPPSALQVLSPDQVSASVTFVVAGEACTPHVVERWSAGRCLINAYGPTEASVYSTVSRPLRQRDAAAPTIGGPVPGFRVYVLDAALCLVPIGACGELYIAGEGLALGYLNRPSLTAARFVPDPFGSRGSRMYRTGDIVRWTPEGDLVFLNRNDDQVKVRGFRIELGEVEAVLLRQPGVARAAAVVREDRPGERRLAGYVVPENGVVIDPTALRAALAGQVPEHLIPVLTVLEAMPLTPSGKIDRTVLPAPYLEVAASGRTELDPVERRVAELVADVLGIEPPDADASFFDLGGDSLAAARLLGRMRVGFGVRPTMRELFAAPTVAGLARRVPRS